MNWDQVQGQWKQMKGAVKAKWGNLTDDDLELIAGRQDQFIGKLQERYGIAREEAKKRADEWLASYYDHGAMHSGTRQSTSDAARAGERRR